MAQPVLRPGTPPSDSPLPSSAAKLLNFVAAYLSISGLDSLEGIIISDSEPVSTDRDKAWLKLDAGTGRALGIYRYLGGWKALPVIVPSGEEEPASPAVGELFYNTLQKVLKVKAATGWTNELWQSGESDERPENVAVGYLYYDTDIKRLLRMTSSGWSTVDGCIGELRMFGDITESEAEERNPGWVIYGEMAGRFPRGYEAGETSVGENGGRATFPVTASGGKNNAQSGAELAVNGISIDGNIVGGSGALVNYASTPQSMTAYVDIIPPFRAVIFMRKQF